MRSTIKYLSHALLPLGMIATLSACNDDDMPRHGFTRAELHATASSTSGETPITVGDFSLEHFNIGIKDVEMMFLHHDAVAAGVTLENGTLKPNTDSPLAKSSAPAKHLVLANAGEVQENAIGNGDTPSGIYNEIKFNWSKSVDSYGPAKSFFLSGTVNDKPVHIWMESEDAVIVPAKSSAGYEISGRATFVLEFNLDRILANVNFNNATDFDNDGIIEIGPNNADANGSIYNVIRNNIAASVQFAKQ
ncbi:MAG TPA: hypothetical protein VK014_04975 [Cyclobacteriaceae bacterium]|nr:hypothetical protein [Cyclobacteriaceae bacterium]